jgi:arylformamidase
MAKQRLTRAQIEDINFQYLPRLTVRNADQYLRKSAERSVRARRKLACVTDLSYGPSAGQVLDVFPADQKGAPVHVFIHGGYWRAREISKAHYSYVAAPMVSAGATVVVPDYDLCPEVRITDIVAQIRAAVVWIYRNIGQYNGDRKNIYLSGHSAGGHLTGMMIATDWTKEGRFPRDLIRGTAPLSGLFDIEPHRHSQLQSDIRLTAKEAKEMSPMYLTPVVRSPSIIAVGSVEPDLFHWQSLAYAAHLRRHRIQAEYLSTPGDHHFSITSRLGKARDPLTRAILAQMGL